MMIAVSRRSRRLAEMLGLTDEVAVVVGGFDQACGALGAGVVEQFMGYYGTGTTEALAVVIDRPRSELGAINMAVSPHVVPGVLLGMAGSQTGGRLLRWYRDEFAHSECEIAAREGRDPYEVIMEGLSEGPSPLMVLPHFTGSGTLQSDPGSRGAVLGLTFRTTRADLAKALLEGLSYEQALCLRQLERFDIHIDRLVVVGGGARSAKWMQIRADILGRRLERPALTDAAARGAALLAGYGAEASASFAGERPSAEAAQVFYPAPARRSLYDSRLDIYESLYGKLIGIARALEQG